VFVLAALAGLLALFVVHVRATYWQCDDAYISSRYVWQLASGHGLVFNPGERVEGYTNFLWVIELAAVKKLFGIDPEFACDWLSILWTVGAFVCVFRLAARGPWAAWRMPVALGATLLLVTSRTWAVWSTSGLETRQFTTCILLGVLALSGGVNSARRLAWASVAFAAAEYTRPEGNLIWAMAGAWLVLEMLLRRERDVWPRLAAYALPFVVLVGAHYLWRHAYYGEWLPNTYYAKYVRPWTDMGLRYFAAAAIETGAWLLIPLAVAGGWARAKRGDRTHLLSACLILPHAVYVTRVGGDNFELRPLDFYWPLVAIAAIEGIAAIGDHIGRAQRRAWLGRATTFVLLALAVVYGSSVQLAKAIVTMPFDTRETARQLTGRIEREGSEWVYALPGMGRLLPLYNDLRSELAPHGVGVLWRVNEVMWRDELEQWRAYGVARGKGILPADGTIARISTGVIGYYLADVEVIDQMGLTDKFVARLPSKRANAERILAHDRIAPFSYLQERGVNMRIQPVQPSRGEALRDAMYALRIDDNVWMPFDSAFPEWVEGAFIGREAWTWAVAREVGCFNDGAAADWTLSGTAFQDSPRANLPFAPIYLAAKRCANQLGLDSRDAQKGGSGRGTARSPAFPAAAGDRLELRIAASSAEGCGARVLVGERVVEVFRHSDPFSRSAQHYDLTPWAGNDVVLQVFDESDESWVVVSDVVVSRAQRL